MRWLMLGVILLAGFSVIVLSQKAYAQEIAESNLAQTTVSSLDKVSDEVLDEKDIKETEAKRDDLKEKKVEALPEQVQYKRRDIRQIRQEAIEKGVPIEAQRKDIRTEKSYDIRELRQERKARGEYIKGRSPRE